MSDYCRKPGCGAANKAGDPCNDWDCPQQVVSASEYRAALAAKDTALSDAERQRDAAISQLQKTGDVARELRERLEVDEAALSEMRAELERAQAEIKRLKTPDSYWEWSDPENGYVDISEALCDAPMGGVVRLMAGKTLDDIWATTRVLTVDDNGDWDDHEIAVFDNPLDAEKCWAESLAAARALAPSIQDEGGER